VAARGPAVPEGALPVAVRTLCEFAARRGDLDHRYTPAPTAQEGIALHARLRERRRQSHQAEVPVAGRCGSLWLRGRIDAVETGSDWLEEFKSHRGDPGRLTVERQARHWAQLRCYGALWAREHGLETIGLRLVYVEVRQGTETVFEQRWSATELWRELETWCAVYADWAAQEAAHRRGRDDFLRGLAFPFSFRAGQRALAEAVYKTLGRNQRLLLQAPTGLGKTLGTLYPALSAMPRQAWDRLVFLTMRGTGRQLALDALQRLLPPAAEGAAPVRVWALVARDQACEHPELSCHGESCPLARGFFDRLPAARAEAACAPALLEPAAVRELALRHEVCPYYLSQEMARWADVVVADVNYWFDQQALLPVLAQQFGWRSALLIDEGHHLLERARAMYSARWNEADWRAARRRAPPALRGAYAAMGRAWRQWQARAPAGAADAPDLLSPLAGGTGAGESSAAAGSHRTAGGQPGGEILHEVPEDFQQAMQAFCGQLLDHLGEQPGDSTLQQALFDAAGFLRLSEAMDQHSILRLSWQPRRAAAGRGGWDACLDIECLLPGRWLAPRWEQAGAAVLFSATLTPYAYFRDLLALPEDAWWLDVPSPFTAAQLEVRQVSGIDTRLAARERSAPLAAGRVLAQFRRAPANYLVYVSSFAYLDLLARALAAQDATLPLRCQRPGMTAAERQAFIDGFAPGGRQVGLAVLGGAFAEGIDLPGSRLMGVFVLTLGLPPHDARHEQLRRRLASEYGDARAYDYTYRYPGLHKVVQAAGRVIRTHEDVGVIELLDDRFARADVRGLLPAWWPPIVPQRAGLPEDLAPRPRRNRL